MKPPIPQQEAQASLALTAEEVLQLQNLRLQQQVARLSIEKFQTALSMLTEKEQEILRSFRARLDSPDDDIIVDLDRSMVYPKPRG